MDFWSTVLGHRLAETLIRYLPKLAKEEVTQYVVTCGATNAAILSVTRDEFEKGGRVVTAIPTSNNQVSIIFEKTE